MSIRVRGQVPGHGGTGGTRRVERRHCSTHATEDDAKRAEAVAGEGRYRRRVDETTMTGGRPAALAGSRAGT